jgi:hypothetical protein
MDNGTVGLLVTWVACGLICFGIAKSKGKNEWIALAVGLLVGFIGVLYYIISKGSKEVRIRKLKKQLAELDPTSAATLKHHEGD